MHDPGRGRAAGPGGRILSGFAGTQKIVASGGRQIVALHLAGDAIGFARALGIDTDPVVALTEVEVALVSVSALRTLMAERPAATQALCAELLRDARIATEWIANVGRRDARTRIAHLLCELAWRQERAGHPHEVPLTQEQLADVTGLTPVHVNRTLQQLRLEGLLDNRRGKVALAHRERMATVGDFRPDYLGSP
jgi:CRP-like cAMP-binding protein